MPCSPNSTLERLALALTRGAALELYLTPKPGLVDLADRGSHPDLSLALMERSIAIVGDYLDALVASLGAGEPFPCQNALGKAAERRMFDELGSNTHKGYIFLSGMLLIARGQAPEPGESAWRHTLAELAAAFFAGAHPPSSHGGCARQRYGCGGIVREAMAGYPAVFEHALPVFRSTLRRSRCPTTASFAMLGRLMQIVDDTTTLHRGGPAGLARLRRDGHRLETLATTGGDCLRFLRATNRDYVDAHLTMGGVADLLAIAYACLIEAGELPAGTPPGLGCPVPLPEALPA